MNTTDCPSCGDEGAYFSIVDENGAHYECPNCDYEWCEDRYASDNSEKDEDYI